MKSVRFPGKPLAMIAGEPMVVHVWRRAVASKAGDVLVAAAEEEVAAAVRAVGGDAVLTDPELPSGTDRVAQALVLRDPEHGYRFIVNLQGDMPNFDPAAIATCLAPLADPNVDIATLASEIDAVHDPNVVKVYIDKGRAIDFRRDIVGPAPYWHHVGVYAFQRPALERFVFLPPSMLEIERQLEQMRAIVAGMTIAVACIDSAPIGVDNPDDLNPAIHRNV